ncbi:cation transporter [Thermaurantiacus tibetensis]|uniref:cation transporter n=1 Tax=Thermaurantiacus tibetensis TaxID=2759035 RepID=UPI00188ECBD2|nr:cation transporter [Thermaurantiacus tibetensis]
MTGFRRTVLTVALLNLAWFAVELVAALRIGSVSLLADSADFLEDASVNLLIAVAAGWSARARARVGMGLALLMLVPAAGFLWTLVGQLRAPQVPHAVTLSAVGAGALLVNLGCAFLLARWRRAEGSLARAAFLSARNDALANLAIIAAAGLTALRPSIWPDIVVGVGIAILNLDAARQVLAAARAEAKAAP